MSAESAPRNTSAEQGLNDDEEVASSLLKSMVPKATPPKILRALRLLAEQSTRGIDYASLGLGWHHPTSRTEYSRAQHESFRHPRSRQRSEASRTALAHLVEAGRAGDEGALSDVESAIVEAFLREVGLGPGSPGAEAASKEASFATVLAALEAELLMPLRALNEGQPSMHTTFNGWPVPPDNVATTVSEIMTHVLRGDFSEWRYSNPVGACQLEGLSPLQIAKWAEATSTEYEGGVVVHEDSPGELGLFWATKIGGPSHGFDIEGQCLLPLLANARHKVVLVSDPAWTYHPVGRAHFRLLWTHPPPSRAMLWLESVNRDFLAKVNSRPWQRMVLLHVVAKADAMCVELSVDTMLQRELEAVVQERSSNGKISIKSDRLLLRPSNGVVEASDYLAGKHDWVQLEDEVTHAHRRCIYTPQSVAGEGGAPPQKVRKVWASCDRRAASATIPDSGVGLPH